MYHPERDYVDENKKEFCVNIIVVLLLLTGALNCSFFFQLKTKINNSNK